MLKIIWGYQTWDKIVFYGYRPQGAVDYFME